MENYQDMVRRIINNAPCPVQVWDRKPGCWPYGTLFLCLKKGERTATFGDLTVPITTAQALELSLLAKEEGSKEEELTCANCPLRPYCTR